MSGKVNKDDPLVRDNKRPVQVGVVAFGVCLLVGVPLFLCVLLPLALVSVLYKKVAGGGPPLRGFPAATAETVSALPPSERKYDVVLLGATGFTGRLAAEYLAKNYSDSKLRWAVAGRNGVALKKLLQDLRCEHIEVLICDTSKPDTLHHMISATRVVATTVGPFTLYGTPIVSLCAQLGTSYCDITGEIDWVRSNIQNFGATAAKSGARIIHCAGHDSVPWDLITWGIAKHLKSKGEAIDEIEIFDEVRGSVSGGTLETMTMIAGATRQKFSFDPLLSDINGNKSATSTHFEGPKFISYSNSFHSWVGFFLMSTVNVNNVKRSNALLNYSKRLVYKESVVYKNFMTAFVSSFTLVLGFTALSIPPLKYILKNYYLPKPGEGPSKQSMDKGYLKVTAFGRGDKGGHAKGVIYFPTDPGYRDTARILVETALTLALDTDRISIGGGVWTPATIAEPLLQRLVDTGCQWTME